MYKAVIFDLDGTAIPNKPEGMPSDNLVAVVKDLQKVIKVCAATGRAWFNSKPIIKRLNMHHPCIVSGGTQIIDPVKESILWQKEMSVEQVTAIMDVARKYPYSVFFSDDETSTYVQDKAVSGPERIIYIEPVSPEDTQKILQELSAVPDIVAHKVMSWTDGHFDIHITHAEATKSHALHILLDLLGLHKDEVVAAGDSDNDLPLFEVAGYKIAMANGTDEVKAKADIVVPSVAEDGLAVALTDLFLKNNN